MTMLTRIPTDPGPSLDIQPHQRRISRHHAMYFESDEDGEDGYSIRAVLAALHSRYPAFHYPAYEAVLLKHGIHYLITASLLDVAFYIERVGMVSGAAYMFCEWVAKEHRRVRRVRHRRKRQRMQACILTDEDKENIEPQ
jgi:hypothetical protein